MDCPGMHRKPGARMLVPEVEACVRTAKTPLISSITELINAGYEIAQDTYTIELTDRGRQVIRSSAQLTPVNYRDRAERRQRWSGY